MVALGGPYASVVGVNIYDVYRINIKSDENDFV